MPFLADNFRSPAALARFLLTTVIALALDLWSKAYAWQTMFLGGPSKDSAGQLKVDSVDAIEVVPGWLHLKLHVNEGAVFGLGQGNQWFFVTVSFAAIGFLNYLFATSGRQRFYQLVLGLLLAGVLGNMYDRVAYGYVRDMIYIFPGKFLFGYEVFPWIFNLADTFLVTGVGMMVIHSVLASREPREPRRAKEPELNTARS